MSYLLLLLLPFAAVLVSATYLSAIFPPTRPRWVQLTGVYLLAFVAMVAAFFIFIGFVVYGYETARVLEYCPWPVFWALYGLALVASALFTATFTGAFCMLWTPGPQAFRGAWSLLTVNLAVVPISVLFSMPNF